MELGLNRVWHGLKLIKQSVQLVIAHPVLLVYGICQCISIYSITFFYIKPLQRKFFTEVIAPALMEGGSFGLDLYLKNIGRLLPVLLGIVVVSYIGVLLLACLCHHAMHILKNEPHGVTETIKGIVRRLPRLSLLCILEIIFTSLSLALGLMFFRFDTAFGTTLLLIIGGIIGYVTSLVLPILAIEQTGIITAIKRSCRLIYNFFMVFIGVFLIFIVFEFGSKRIMPLNIPVIIVLGILAQNLRMLTYTIFYYEYYVQPKSGLTDIFSQDV